MHVAQGVSTHLQTACTCDAWNWFEMKRRSPQVLWHRGQAGKGFVILLVLCLSRRLQCAAKHTHANASTALVGSGAQVKLPGPPVGRIRAATLPWPV
jgi:hypothetical protein